VSAPRCPGRAPAFTAWLDAFFAAYYRSRPVNATFIGVHAFDDRLPDFSEQAAGDAAAETAALLATLRGLPAEPLAESEALDRRLAEGVLLIQQWEDRSVHFHRGNPCVYTGEAIFGVIALFLRPFAPLADRVEAAIARMARIPALLAQGRANVLRAPGAWIDRAIRECAGARAFLTGGVDALIREHGLVDLRLRQTAGAAAAAFAEFAHHLEVELTPRATAEYAAGGDALELLVRHGHFLDEDPRALAAAAAEELAAADGYLTAHAAEFGARTWREALAQLAGRHPTAEQYYGRYTEIWRAARAAAETHGLVTWPEFPIRYVPQPEWARGAAPHLYFLAYRSPAAFDRLPAVDYLVTPVEPGMPPEEQTRRLRAANDSVIKLNHVIHHGGLGHHVQNWHAFRAASRIGQVAAVDCASRLAMFCGGTMAEGWACYAVDLMDEIGFLEPLERYAQRHTRLRQAARTVVDVRLHLGLFTLEDAAAFYRDRAGMAPDAARAEAVKNSMFPGAALMYLAGADRIHGLRRELAARGGLDLRRFHDRFLSFGSVPVPLVAAAMRQEPAHVLSE